MKKNLNKLATLALTGILMTGMSFGALAATTTDGVVNNLKGDSELILKKEMKIVDVDDENYTAEVAAPGVKYTYTIVPAKNTELGDAVGNVPRKVGEGGAEIKTGTETVFAVTDRAETNGRISKNIELDFSKVNWTEPGIYRYKLTEEGYTSTQNNYAYTEAIRENTSDTRYVDVYVGYYDKEVEGETKQALGIIGYAVSKTNDGEKTTGFEVVEEQGGTGGYGSVYSAYDVKVTKFVTGNLGNKNGNFAFTGSVDMASGAGYGYAKGESEATEKTGYISATLNDKEYFIVKGVPVGHNVTVEEDNYTADGYTTTVQVNGETVEGYTAGLEVTGSDNKKDGVSTVEFTNERKNTTPAGVVMNIAPYAAMILGAGAFAGVFLGKRKSEEEE